MNVVKLADCTQLPERMVWLTARANHFLFIILFIGFFDPLCGDGIKQQNGNRKKFTVS
jgi:hypothetical protein